MKMFNIISLMFLLGGLVSLPKVYDYSVPTIEGGNQSLSFYQGKKILIVTLPIEQSATADSFLYSLDTLAAAHATELKVIAVPSYEDGYAPSIKIALTQWYRTKLDTSILITEGLYTRRTSGNEQHALYNWLTDDSLNESFNMDVTGPNYKFFIRENGELYGVLDPLMKVSGRAVYKTLHLQ